MKRLFIFFLVALPLVVSADDDYPEISENGGSDLTFIYGLKVEYGDNWESKGYYAEISKLSDHYSGNTLPVVPNCCSITYDKKEEKKFPGNKYYVKSIAPLAFENCTKLTSATISFNGYIREIPNLLFKGCVNLTKVKIGGGITKIGSDIFEGCSKLTTLVIPSTIVDIYDNNQIVSGMSFSAFSGARNLKSVFVSWTDKESIPTLYNENMSSKVDNQVFYYKDDYSVYDHAILYVPEGCIDIYQNSEKGWERFKNIKEIVKGDADVDGELTEKDREMMTDYIMEKNPSSFNEEAADLNGDEKVDVTDIVKLNDLLAPKD